MKRKKSKLYDDLYLAVNQKYINLVYELKNGDLIKKAEPEDVIMEVMLVK